MSLEKAFGIALKKTRDMRAMTQAKVAEKSDLDVTYIGLLERGRRQPSLKAFIKLASALDVSPIELMKRTLRELQTKN